MTTSPFTCPACGQPIRTEQEAGGYVATTCGCPEPDPDELVTVRMLRSITTHRDAARWFARHGAE